MPTLEEVSERNTLLRPGFIVVLKTALIGNISYHKVVLEREHMTDEGTEEARWETKRVIGDRAEHDAGRKAQADARAKVSAVCTNTAFGLICALEDEAALATALAEAKEIAAVFNRTARHSRVIVRPLVGQLQGERFDVVGAMAAEALDLINQVHAGVAARNAQEIREAANDLRRLAEMFSAEGRGPLEDVVNAGRGAARKIVKLPEGPAHELEVQALGIIAEVRTAFERLAEGGSLRLNQTV